MKAKNLPTEHTKCIIQWIVINQVVKWCNGVNAITYCVVCACASTIFLLRVVNTDALSFGGVPGLPLAAEIIRFTNRSATDTSDATMIPSERIKNCML
jgi:hypothetical protein